MEAIFRVAVRTVRRFVYVALAQGGNTGLINACNYLAVVDSLSGDFVVVRTVWYLVK